MYCSKCGKLVEDGGRFCGFCGAPVAAKNPPQIPTRTTGDMIKTEKDDTDISISDAAHIEPERKRAKKNVMLPIATVAVLVIVGVFLITNTIGKNSANNVSEPTYALPELPDALGVLSFDDENRSVVGSKVIGTYSGSSAQIAENGTIAIQADDNEEVQIYKSDGMQIGTIPAPVAYFILCGSGEKIVYGPDNDITYVWDVSSGESELISEDYRAYGISYSGDTLDMDSYYKLEGQEPVYMQFYADILAMSPDGKYIYYRRNYYIGSEQYCIFGVYIDGKDHELLSYPDPNYFPYIIAVSSDYKDVVFGCRNDVYFYSVDRANYIANRVDGVNDGHLIALNNVMSDQPYGDTVYSWLGRNNQDCWWYATRPRTVNSVFDVPYCLLKEEKGVYSVSLVKLVDMQIVELIPNITGNICLSADETKLWCVANGRLAFCDFSMDEPSVSYCDTTYVGTYDSYGNTPINRPIAMTSDGLTVCFVGYDGTLWMCTPETINTPTAVMSDTKLVKCSSDNIFYFVKCDDLSSYRGPGELYMIDQNGQAIYQYGHVFDVHVTKSDVYIVVESEDEYEGPDPQYALYRKNKERYELLVNNCSDTINYIYWGES